MRKCFVCGVMNDDQLDRSPLPKELLGPNEYGDILEDLQPICKKCNTLRKVVDNNFIRLCEDARLFEWYRSNSRNRSDYFPPTFVYNVEIEVLIGLYYQILKICEDADRIASDDKAREEKREEFNYEWRKRDA